MTLVEEDLSRVSPVLALTQCAVCPQTIPQNFAITAKYLGDIEHFCSDDCRLLHEAELDRIALEKLRGAGL